MKYKFCRIRINVTKYDITFATKGGSNSFNAVCTLRRCGAYRIISKHLLSSGNTYFLHALISFFENIN